jgi:hypothetical protein
MQQAVAMGLPGNPRLRSGGSSGARSGARSDRTAIRATPDNSRWRVEVGIGTIIRPLARCSRSCYGKRVADHSSFDSHVKDVGNWRARTTGRMTARNALSAAPTFIETYRERMVTKQGSRAIR